MDHVAQLEGHREDHGAGRHGEAADLDQPSRRHIGHNLHKDVTAAQYYNEPGKTFIPSDRRLVAGPVGMGIVGVVRANALDVLPVGVHHIERQVTVAAADEGDARAVG